MDIYEFPPIRILISAAYWLVTRLSELLEPLAGTGSAAAAVILLTIAVRIVLIPVGRSQVRAGIIRQRLAPQLAELQRRHKKNPELLQRKTMELYAAEKSSPFAGCLPVLAQTPLLMAVYGLFIRQTIDGHANELLTHTFLGIPLDAGLIGQIAAGTADWGSAAVFVAIMVLIAIVAQASRRLLMPTTPAERPEGAPDLSRMMRVLSFMPFITAAVAAFVPLAAALYLLTTTTWTLGERIILRRVLGGSPGAGEAVAVAV
ncbi:YidC/Oxa1 family membrane protein insertase [Microbacterium halotolerans]|uniref:YidC/Oxa1 family membrane protein insertase n=1 Tax=Microbacterium halotolerans TaxID=246613 RepID=UPI000E6AB6F9|nr:YidC/Oxa1 family membrane protein insertase [Microbacterium halotolerans]